MGKSGLELTAWERMTLQRLVQQEIGRLQAAGKEFRTSAERIVMASDLTTLLEKINTVKTVLR